MEKLKKHVMQVSFASILFSLTFGAWAASPSMPTTPAPGASASPGILLSGTSVNLNWTSVKNTTYYSVGVKDLAANRLEIDVTSKNASYSAILTAGKSYKWNVAACNSSGCSQYTPPLYFKTPSPPARYLVTTIKSGTGTGTIGGENINCGGTCSAQFAGGATTTFTATPSSDSNFTGWNICNGIGSCVVTITTSQSVVATFTKKPANYSLAINKTGSGTVKGTNIDCGNICSAQFVSGTAVILTAIPDSDWTFGGWSGGCDGIANCKVNLTASKSVTAIFVKTPVLNAAIASAALSQISTTTTATASPRSLATMLPLFDELDSSRQNAVLRKQTKTWYTDLEDGGTGTQDGTRIRDAIQKYATWKGKSSTTRVDFDTLRGQMETAIGPIYDKSRRQLLASRIVQNWDANELRFNQRVPNVKAPTVPVTDQETIDFLGIRTQCLEWVVTTGLRSGAQSISYQSTAVSSPKSHRPGMAMFWYDAKGYGAHAAIITDIKFDLQGNPTTYTVAESNYGQGWQNPGGEIPWERIITPRTISAAVNPPDKPTEKKTSGRVVNFVTR